MLQITENAKKALFEVLEEQKKQDHYLRISIAGMGCCGPTYGLSLDNEIKEDDKTTIINDVNIVYNNELEKSIDNLTVDYVDNEFGKGFIVEDETASSDCGGSCSGCGY